MCTTKRILDMQRQLFRQSEELKERDEEIEALKFERANLQGALQEARRQNNNCKTAYLKGMRHIANALKDYNRVEGAWTDYFEHSVDIVLKRELNKQGIK